MFQGPDLVSCQAPDHIWGKLAKEATHERGEEGRGNRGVTTRGWGRPHSHRDGRDPAGDVAEFTFSGDLSFSWVLRCIASIARWK